MEECFKGNKDKKCFNFTTWKCCKSISNRRSRKAASGRREEDHDQVGKRRNRRKRKATPEGCFSVYVGKERQRFVIRAESANHPSFKKLLEEAKSEYGYSSEGPLWLPCKVAIFNKVMREMEDGLDILYSYSFSNLNGSHHLLSSSRWME